MVKRVARLIYSIAAVGIVAGVLWNYRVNSLMREASLANTTMWNNMGVETPDKTDRVFIQLQILETQLLQTAADINTSLIAIAGLLALILLVLLWTAK